MGRLPEGAGILVLKTDHIVFPVWDAAESLKFYRDVMGFALIETHSGDDWGGFAWLMLIFSPGDGREIVLVNLRGAKRPQNGALPNDVRHLAFTESTTSKLGSWREKLRKSKVPFWEETHGPRHSIYFEDPNGMVLEITAPPSKPATKKSRTALSAATRWINAKS
jgi:catechol 2,3-dioxygenase-like lactoylglutathione lyase family enzyme